MKTNLTLNNTGYIAEWWHQKPGEPTRKSHNHAEI